MKKRILWAAALWLLSISSYGQEESMEQMVQRGLSVAKLSMEQMVQRGLSVAKFAGHTLRRTDSGD